MSEGVIRYAVVGLGHIAQVAALPGFRHARRNSRLTALISNDPVKRKILGEKYGISKTYSYDEYEQCLHSGEIDAVYIALPNSMHRDFAVRASNAGIHVLTEKPMAVSEAECREMMKAAKDNGTELMTAYRLHFEPANLEAMGIIEDGKIGKPRIFNSTFSEQVKKGDIRTQRNLGGGTLWDLGIYCINAARYLFRDEPTEVLAITTRGNDPRFHQVDEMTSAILKFPKDRIATFTSSFGAMDTSMYEVIGTEGALRMEPAYDYSVPLRYQLTMGNRITKKKFPRRDQFGAEILYFSDCILRGRSPEPSGWEGLIDVHIIEALYESARTKRMVKLEPLEKIQRPSFEQQISLAPVEMPRLVRETAPAR